MIDAKSQGTLHRFRPELRSTCIHPIIARTVFFIQVDIASHEGYACQICGLEFKVQPMYCEFCQDKGCANCGVKKSPLKLGIYIDADD